MKKLSKRGAQMSWFDIIALGSAKGFGGLGMGLLAARYLKPKDQQKAGALFFGLGVFFASFLIKEMGGQLCNKKCKKD